jgi:hypothetical protein
MKETLKVFLVNGHHVWQESLANLHESQSRKPLGSEIRASLRDGLLPRLMRDEVRVTI